MKVFQSIKQHGVWSTELPQHSNAQWVLLFGSANLLACNRLPAILASAYPHALVVGCTTSGEICGSELYDDSLVLTAIEFTATQLKSASAKLNHISDYDELTKDLVNQLVTEDLRHIMVLSDGHSINGSELVDGLNQHLPHSVTVSGGLAGDGDRFQQTYVYRDGECVDQTVLAIGLYGDNVFVSTGYEGGWRSFGPSREITLSDANVVYTIDEQPALELYKSFLGKFAAELPSSALLYPLSLQAPNDDSTVVRTILGIDEDNSSMRFAGNMPAGAKCQLMHSNTEALIDAAESAANNALSQVKYEGDSLAILVSCVGRRLVMGHRVIEELEAVQSVLPASCSQTGFYSYGEISTMLESAQAGLHNQTLAVTLIGEKAVLDA